ncbi:MAG: glutamyl-tRNA reductase, partial [Alphaproteobacteria bacterium]|nr:glutamyl-tRNA reductase [Alphaproteobacteria bacterium]
MTAAPALLARLVVVGANHRSSPLALRDQLFFDDEALPAFLAGLAARGVGHALALSTCDRVEVVAAHPDPDLAERAIREAFAERAGRAPAELAAQLYALSGVEAVRHCFAVTASLDSQIIGEPHVLGQVKAAHRLCRLGGGEVEALLQAAYATAKRVRAETTVAEGPVSIASAAVRVACDLHGDLRRCEALLIGAGEMGELVAESLLAAGLNRLLITAPRASRAETLARALGCATLPFADFGPALAEADIVLT